MKSIKAYMTLAGLALLLSCQEKQVETDCKGPATDRVCTQQYEPVCGCDGLTYGNSCIASASGVRYFTPGECIK